MPELSVTEEQLERLESLRAELEATFVDGYGHVRRRDAVDYLFDTHTPPAEERVRRALDRRVRDEDGDIDYPALQSVARNTEGVKGSGMPAEEMYVAVLEAKVEELEAGRGVGLGAAPVGGSDAAASGEETGTPDPDAEGDAAEREVEASDGADEADADVPDDGGDATEEEPEPAEVDDEGVDANDEGDDAGAATDENESADPADGEGSGPSGNVAASSNGGGSPLQTMMNLLRTHDDKWRKAQSGDAPYEVDLPDGGTEAARTKDDVKRILFRNY